MPKHLLEVGWEEWIALPELNIFAIRAKVDTGAKTSSLHAFMVEKIYENGVEKIKFGLHPIPDRPEIELYCKAHLIDEREVTSSNGQTELRYVIRTTAQFGRKKWPIEITLTNRETMAYRMLLGRSALQERVLVVPEASCLLGELSPDMYKENITQRPRRALRICILSREPNCYSTQRLASAAEARGHQVDVINTTRCYVHVSGNEQNIHYQGEILNKYDAVIPRIGASITFYGLSILRQFESLGTYCVNPSSAIGYSRDKLFAHQLLARGQIDMPVTAFAHYSGDTNDIIKIVRGAPLIIKLLEGTQGRGVILAETGKAANAVIQAFRGLRANFIVQEYIKESAGRDIRCIVIGTRVVAAMERRGVEGEFRSNVHQGGTTHTIRITPQERKMAVKATRILGLKFAGVDLLRSSKGPKIIEVNSSPGLEGIETVTGRDIAALLAEFIEQHARPVFNKKISG
jgi:ribosomal protein S6--L-glutamate ligase